ncbi:VOC family protein [Yunchengibacter salinarum]|uniref:VOC family protein n=1 Tax=Yunchengibacter salinarum TaxID=3133399 RepID=UPI0035B61905
MSETGFKPADTALLSPYLTVDGAARAVDWYGDVLGFHPLHRLESPDGRLMHAELRLDGQTLMVSDAWPEHGRSGPDGTNAPPVSLMLYVPDVDAAHARALGAGATELMAPDDMFWGDRMARFRDPFGHDWAVATHHRHVDAEELAAIMDQMQAEDA